MVLIAAVCGYCQTPATVTITIRMIDAKTGQMIPTSDFLIRIDHQEDEHGNWVKQNEDGSGKLTLPANALIVAAEGKYASSTTVYVNCDSVRDKPEPVVHWYTISEILASGAAAPNECSKHTTVAKPGEFVFFVRQRNWKEQYKDFQ
jgi:hypothetical protein